MRFVCDDNLGKLAKYLRLLGYDTHWEANLTDAALIALALRENRVILTRDRRLTTKVDPGRILLIVDDDPRSQIKQVISAFGLNPDDDQLFSRCLLCNALCVEVDKEKVKDSVFPFVWRTQERFHRCPDCGRLYWAGSHYKDMLTKLETLLGRPIR